MENLSRLNIKMDIQGAWKPSLANQSDVFIIEAFIDEGYPTTVLEVLNNIRVYMKVAVLSDTSKHNGIKLVNWVLRSEEIINHKWKWSPTCAPTTQNMKAWRDCLRGTFMKGINDIMEPTASSRNIVDHIVYPLFEYITMHKQDSLQDTILQYPTELLTNLRSVSISDEEGLKMMHHIADNMPVQIAISQ